MGESHQQQHHQPTASRFGLRNTGGGEIVEVQGGHIVRSTGRKDRHSKVCTAKGPRDRRVRLSAHTAIQFYDVQDRLGYDRPSKAVDWLIKKAKAAIDELAELPAWKPTNCSTALTTFEQNQEDPHHQQLHMQTENENQQPQQQLQIGNHENSSSFLPPSLDSDSIADTIKSFFPMGASSAANTSAMQFQSFPPPDLLSRTSSQSQDLRLSLQFQDPMLLHHHHHHQQQQQQHHHNNPTHQNEQSNLYSGPTHLAFDGSSWSEHPSWGGGGGSGGGGFVFNSPTQTTPFLQPLFGQTQLFSSQRGPLQSSNTPSVRAWIDPPPAFSTAPMDHHQHHQALSFNPSSMSGGIGFASGGGFSGFRIPARIQGEEEEHDGISDKPSSASSDSHH